MLKLLQIDRDYEEGRDASYDKTSPFLQRPIMEIALDMQRFRSEIQMADPEELKYLMLKAA